MGGWVGGREGREEDLGGREWDGWEGEWGWEGWEGGGRVEVHVKRVRCELATVCQMEIATSELQTLSPQPKAKEDSAMEQQLGQPWAYCWLSRPSP